MTVIEWLKARLTLHNWETYAREGPYEDGQYWNYRKCKYCGETSIGPKQYINTDSDAGGDSE